MASPSSSIGSISLDVGHRNQSMTTVTATASAIATASNTKQAKMADLEEFQKQTRSLALKVEEILGAVRVDASQVREALAQHMIELVFVCVIITYLTYYFSQLSKVS